MHIPRFWAKESAETTGAEEQPLALTAWGWGDDAAQAGREAKAKLDRLLDRVRRGEPFPDKYAYGSRPLREEILETHDGGGEPHALLTRNRYGATVLNAARLLFLDVDLPDGGVGVADGLLGRLFSKEKRKPEDVALDTLRTALKNAGKGRFRIYRTAAGFRALAVDREFDPAGREAQDLMKATGTDPFFIRLCLAQKSFRARLTPKPWRMGLKPPPGEYPRDPEMQRRFEEWLAEYEEASTRHATCKYLETVGGAMVDAPVAEDLVALHDRLSRATEPLPLA
jgi:hypothetical protein